MDDTNISLTIKRFLLLLFAISAGFLAHSQDKFRFGLTASPGISWLTPDNPIHEKEGVRFALTYGLLIDYKFGGHERYAFHTGLNITMAGGSLSSSLPDSLGTFNAQITPKLQYFEIPIGMKLRSNEANKLVYYGLFGATIGAVIRSRADYENVNPINSISGENVKLRDIPFYPGPIDKAIPLNIGMQIEAGLEYSISETVDLVMGLYFNNGFSNVLKDNDEERVVLRRLGLRLGLLF